MEHLLPSPSRGSLLRLAASVGLALILWAWVTTLRDPETSRTFSGVEVAVNDLAETLVILDPPEEVQVRITGPESVIDSVTAGALSASLELAEVSQPGTYDLPVAVDVPEGVWRTQTTPEAVEVTIESAVSQVFRLEVSVHDIDASSLRTVTVSPTVEEVTVTGPSSAMEQVSRVVLPLETSGGSRTYQTTLTPVALDANDVAVEGVTIDPPIIPASVSVAARGKSVAVLISTEGSPAAGFEVIDRTANPASVIVEGPRDVIDQMIAVSAEPIDITGASSSVSATVQIVNLPEGVSIIQPQSGEVDVLVQIGQQGVRQSLTGLEVAVTNIEPGLAASITPEEITIEVMAPEEVLSTLTVESFQVIVDAEGLPVGTYTMEPMVIVPAQVQWMTATPTEIELVITEDSTPVGESP